MIKSSLTKSVLLIVRITAIAIAVSYPNILQAIITVEVSPEFSSIYTTNTVELFSGNLKGSILPDTPFKDSYLIELAVIGGKARALVLDKRDEETSNPNPVPIINRVVQGRTLIKVPYIRSGSGGIFFVKNEQHKKIEAKWKIYRTGTRPPSVTKPIRELIEISTETINKLYKTPDMTLTVSPCGHSNAYVGKNIIICSELVSELSDKKYINALPAIIIHELAHVLLKYWNLPGYDNEDLVDEFALAFLGKYMRNSITSLIGWLEAQDSIQEAIYQIYVGDRHSISIQRARNLKNGLEHIDEIMNRWSNVLKPYFILEGSLSKIEPDKLNFKNTPGYIPEFMDSILAVAPGICENLIYKNQKSSVV